MGNQFGLSNGFCVEVLNFQDRKLTIILNIEDLNNILRAFE